MRLEHEVEIQRPPDAVFAYLADPRNLPRWQSSVTSVEAPEAVGLGARFTEVRRRAGHGFHSTLEVTEFEPGSVFAIRVVSGLVKASIRHTLEAAGPGTRLRVTAEAELDSLPRVVRALVSRSVEGELARDFDCLKSVVEAS